MIYRGFRKENRIIWNLYTPVGIPEFREKYSLMMASNLATLREEAKHKLLEALSSDLFTMPQKVKVFEKNFDEFVYEQRVSDVVRLGYKVLKDPSSVTSIPTPAPDKPYCKPLPTLFAV